MEEKKSVANVLREYADNQPRYCGDFRKITMGTSDCRGVSCFKCREEMTNALADMIEAEQTELLYQRDSMSNRYKETQAENLELRAQIKELSEASIDVSALNLLCDKLEMGGEKSRDIAMQIRAALNGAERNKTEHGGVDVAKLLGEAETLESWAAIAAGNPNTCVSIGFGTCLGMANRIRKAVDGANVSNSMPLPEGVEWPRYESGELVEFGDEIGKGDIWMEHPVDLVAFYDDGSFELWGDGNSIAYRKGEPVKRPEPEVLDADGVPIKVGDTVYDEDGKAFEVEAVNATCKTFKRKGGIACEWKAEFFTHRKPDTAESLLREFIDAANSDDGPDLTPIIERSLKLLGGE